MGFDSTSFLNEKFEARTENVKVPELKAWFGKGDPPVWIIRGLEGNEIAKAAEIAERRNLSTAILEGLLTMKADDVKKAVERLIGRSDDFPAETAKRVEYLICASVDPQCTEEMAVKLNKSFPIVFMQLTNRILALSGLGMMPGKSKPFGATKKSKQA